MFVFSNSELITYAKLARYSYKDLKERDYDLIILDEFHRPGAQEWGKGVETLLRANPHAKVFGTTATPVRYLDYSRDMSKELFNRNIANEITLPSAIARHILKTPKYITALYTIDEEIEQLKKRIFTLHHIIMAFTSS